MALSYPSARPYANDAARFCLVWQRKRGEVRFEIGFWTIALGGAILFLLAAWYLIATLYLVFRDDMVANLMSSNASMQYAYEDRINALRLQAENASGRVGTDQSALTARVRDLLERQAKLERRNALVLALGVEKLAPMAEVDAVETGSILATPSAPRAVPLPLDDAKTKTLATPVPGLRSDASDGRDLVGALRLTADRLDALETVQVRALAKLETKISTTQQRFAAIIDTLGLAKERFISAAAPPLGNASQSGGPLVPITGDGAFENAVKHLRTLIDSNAAIEPALDALPLRRPVSAANGTSSGFGPRSDPFLRTPAMHTGLDFRGDTGDRVRATAAGRVTHAGPMGGYGNLVEVDHGFGLATRYGHLSRILVNEGDVVPAGYIIGEVGSTGRSTGPHLHYETRIDGEAVDPIRFLSAGRRFGAEN